MAPARSWADVAASKGTQTTRSTLATSLSPPCINPKSSSLLINPSHSAASQCSPVLSLPSIQRTDLSAEPLLANADFPPLPSKRAPPCLPPSPCLPTYIISGNFLGTDYERTEDSDEDDSRGDPLEGFEDLLDVVELIEDVASGNGEVRGEPLTLTVE